MSSFKGLYSMISVPGEDGDNVFQIRYLYWLTVLLMAVAALEFGQDYISAVLNGNQFQVSESLSYKLFWVFFIPLSMLLGYGLQKTNHRLTGSGYLAVNVVLVVFITVVHLLLFSIVLFGISNLIHENPWTLASLLYEKLSTRLYIAGAIYLTLSVAYFRIQSRKVDQQYNQHSPKKTIRVKNGTSSVIVDVDEITWISSDGAYLEIHTNGKKHVILDSLKNIIESLPDNFKRIHRSTIVNIDCVKELQSRGNGDYDVILNDRQTLRLSRNYAKPLKGQLL